MSKDERVLLYSREVNDVGLWHARLKHKMPSSEGLAAPAATEVVTRCSPRSAS